MSQKPNYEVFPFRLSEKTGKVLFANYVRRNKEALNLDRGEMVLTTVDGVTGMFRQWSYAEVSVTVVSETDVEFTTYGLETVFGLSCSGDIQDKIECHYPTLETLQEAITARKRAIAITCYEDRLEAERVRIYNEGVAKVHLDLFGM